MGAIESRYRTFLADRAEAGLHRAMPAISAEGPGVIKVDGTRYTNFSSNEYLGLSQHPELIARAKEWTTKHGAGSGASRLVTGNLDLFEQIEAKTAKLKSTSAALVMVSGFQANATVLQALLDRQVLDGDPLVFADRLNHASMHFGCWAAGVRQFRYRHCDAAHLKSLLAKHAGDERPKFILTESVFSMDGDLAPMQEIKELARQHGAFLICDDAHATGILGKEGCGMSAGADLVIGTFSKALGCFGAYVACSQTLRDYLVNRCAGLIYSTALPPAVLGAIDASLDLLSGLDDERRRVAEMADEFRRQAVGLGYDTGNSASQIVPLVVGEAETAIALSAKLAEAGIWATAIRPPTVPKGSARLRLAFTAAHSSADLERLLGQLTPRGQASARA